MSPAAESCVFLSVCVSVCGGLLLPCACVCACVVGASHGDATLRWSSNSQGCATSLDEMEGKTRSSKDGHSLKLLKEQFGFKK